MYVRSLQLASLMVQALDSDALDFQGAEFLGRWISRALNLSGVKVQAIKSPPDGFKTLHSNS